MGGAGNTRRPARAPGSPPVSAPRHVAPPPSPPRLARLSNGPSPRTRAASPPGPRRVPSRGQRSLPDYSSAGASPGLGSARDSPGPAPDVASVQAPPLAPPRALPSQRCFPGAQDLSGPESLRAMPAFLRVGKVTVPALRRGSCTQERPGWGH